MVNVSEMWWFDPWWFYLHFHVLWVLWFGCAPVWHTLGGCLSVCSILRCMDTLYVFVQQVLHMERLGTHGTLEGPTVSCQVTLELHLGGETILTEQAPIKMKNFLNIQSISYTVKHSYSTQAYNELTLIVKWFSFPLDFKYIEKLMNITNNIYNEAKLSHPWHLVICVFYCTCKLLWYIMPHVGINVNIRFPHLWKN